jgi:hypothetical protein
MKKYGQRGVGTRPKQVYDSASTICAKTFITYITLIAPAINILADGIFGTGILYWYVPHITGTLASYPAPPFRMLLSPLPLPSSFNLLEVQCSYLPGTPLVTSFNASHYSRPIHIVFSGFQVRTLLLPNDHH